MRNSQIQLINLKNLTLDIENPRLPLSFKESERSEVNILEDASIVELMLAIGEKEYEIQLPLQIKI